MIINEDLFTTKEEELDFSSDLGKIFYFF